MEVHIVQKGDTLWKISRQYGISFEELKRVNAHLANPDYIVPGMKIFLPNEGKSKTAPPNKQTEDVTKKEKVEERPIIEKKPVKRPEVPQEKHEQQKKPEKEQTPIPLPKPPTITTKPIEKEQKERPKQQRPPTEKPKHEQPKVPPQHECPPQQMQPIIPVQPYPIYGIPCGWMPIYDADCYGHHHYYQRQGVPRQPMPTRPMTQLPVEESAHHKTSTPPIHPVEREPKELPKSSDREKVRPVPPKLTAPPLMAPGFTPNIESPSVPLPRPKGEQQEQFVPPIYNEQTQQRIEQPTPYPPPNSYPVHAGEWPSYGGHQFTPMPMVQPQSHPFCHQCHQPLGQSAQPPMHFPGFYPWQGPHS